jgi:DNA-binding MarR family transcriptional regulator
MDMASPTLLPPEQQICFALYNASRSITARYRDLLAPLGITYTQYLVLMVLWQEGTASASHIGDRLQLESGTLSPLLRRLAALDLVTRERSADDERVIEIALTAKGDKMRSHAPHIADQICAATGLPMDDLVALQAEITALADRVRAIS